jgi:hypothetical protein
MWPPTEIQFMTNISQDELKAARKRRDKTTGAAVRSALGQRPTIKLDTTSAPAGPAGSMWSSDKVVIPHFELPARNIAGHPKFKYPTGTNRPHAIFRIPAHVSLADVNEWKPKTELSQENKWEYDRRNFPVPELLENSDEFQEIRPSLQYEEIASRPRMGASSLSIKLVDQLMQGDGQDMALFGRWRLHKDAPISFVKDTIEQELRGPGANSLHGFLKRMPVASHPLVRHHHERIVKEMQEDGDQLSPPMMEGTNASQRYALRTKTRVTFNMNEEGTFQSTGFHQRTGSTGSTVESSEGSNSATDFEQKNALHDSGIHGLQSTPSAREASDGASPVPQETQDSSNLGLQSAQPPQEISNGLGQVTQADKVVLANHVLLPLNPDPALDYEGINNDKIEPYRRFQQPKMHRLYIRDFCNNVDHLGRVYPPYISPRSRQGPQQGTAHTSTTQQEQPTQQDGVSRREQHIRSESHTQQTQVNHPEQQAQPNRGGLGGYAMERQRRDRPAYVRRTSEQQTRFEQQALHQGVASREQTELQENLHDLVPREHSVLQEHIDDVAPREHFGTQEDLDNVVTTHEHFEPQEHLDDATSHDHFEPDEHLDDAASRGQSEQQEPLDVFASLNQDAPPILQAQFRQHQHSGQQSTSATTRQSKRVSFDISKNLSRIIPRRADSRVILVAPEDAESAMMSNDEEDTVVDAEPLKFAKTNSAHFGSLSSQGMLNKQTLNDASGSANHKPLRPILKRSSSSALESHSSSVASVAANVSTGVNTSFDTTPNHATPGTTASSGDDREIKSPARAEYIGRKLAEHLKHAHVTDAEDEDDFKAAKDRDDLEAELLTAGILL